MPYKSITVSEEAYRQLERMKEGKESFTDAIIRLARRDNARRLLEVLHHLGPDEDLAASVERVYRQRRRVRPREVQL
jgi:predicted CopG family antitoxin